MEQQATWSEIVKLDLRVGQLESAFLHRHVNQDGTDACKQCGLDLRDNVHERVRP